MEKRKYEEWMKQRDDALNDALELLRPFFSSYQILANANMPDERIRPDFFATKPFRRGHGDHAARVQLCRTMVERDEVERKWKIEAKMAENYERKGEVGREGDE